MTMPPPVTPDADDPDVAATPAAPPVSQYGNRGLESWFEAHLDRYTVEALSATAAAAGWSDDAVREAAARASSTLDAAPTKARAKAITNGLFLGTFLLLAAGMLVNESAKAYGSSIVGTVVLGVACIVGFVFGRLWIRLMRPAGGSMAVLMLVPVLLWLAIAGICVASGLPIPRAAA